ncbi:hypothetical protein KP004_04270 [Geomonas oryzisoli]|uniref:Uncharacterized protein n=1 Tax=Geomonas oryzisoli TaxID=2847992 RepID=A0ABX8J9Y1_9BACT|nr:hypothetical protein [Geomonas oryzisoli]QWV94409.1 hypothetical protein KP004_04270 [Geomonas oryzisoli]
MVDYYHLSYRNDYGWAIKDLDLIIFFKLDFVMVYLSQAFLELIAMLSPIANKGTYAGMTTEGKQGDSATGTVYV